MRLMVPTHRFGLDPLRYLLQASRGVKVHFAGHGVSLPV